MKVSPFRTSASSFSEARTLVRWLWGMSLSCRDGEYRLNYPNGEEATAYYTNDLQDAIDTAEAMRLARPQF